MAIEIGKEIGLDASAITHAQQDPTVKRIAPLRENEKTAIIEAFNQKYSDNKPLEKINRQPDGSPGLVTFRGHVFQVLCEYATQ